VPEVAATRAGGVEPDAVEPIAERVDRSECFVDLVGVGVTEGDPRDRLVDGLVEGAPRGLLLATAEADGERVGSPRAPRPIRSPAATCENPSNPPTSAERSTAAVIDGWTWRAPKESTCESGAATRQSRAAVAIPEEA